MTAQKVVPSTPGVFHSSCGKTQRFSAVFAGSFLSPILQSFLWTRVFLCEQDMLTKAQWVFPKMPFIVPTGGAAKGMTRR